MPHTSLGIVSPPGSFVYSLAARTIRVTKFTLSQTLTFDAIGFLAYSGVSEVRAVVYSDNAGVPGTLLAQADSMYGVAFPANVDTVFQRPLMAPLTLVPGTYFIGVYQRDLSAPPGGLAVQLRTTSGAANNTYLGTVSDPDAYGNAPDTFPTPTYVIRDTNAYLLSFGVTLDVSKIVAAAVISPTPISISKLLGSVVVSTETRISVSKILASAVVSKPRNRGILGSP